MVLGKSVDTITGRLTYCRRLCRTPQDTNAPRAKETLGAAAMAEERQQPKPSLYTGKLRVVNAEFCANLLVAISAACLGSDSETSDDSANTGKNDE
jgi:fructosamine-3-kinase